MATYDYAINGVPLNVNPIGNGWTMRHGSFSVSAINAITTPIGSKAWHQEISGAASRAVIFDAVSATTDDVEILTLERRDSLSVELGHLHRCTTEGDRDYYSMGARNNATEVRTRVFTNGSTANQYAALHGLTYDLAKWYWVRTKIVSTTAMYVSMWEYGTTEPVTPQLVETGLTLAYSTGVVGLSGYWGSSLPKDIAWFSVGTGGDAAPGPSPRKSIIVTDLRAPNAWNTAIPNTTGVQVKLWIDKVDEGIPDVLVTDASITDGAVSISLEGTVGAAGTPAVRGTNAASSGTTDTLTGYAHPGGGLVVFHLCNSNSTVSATFNGVSMTFLAKGVFDDSSRQMAAFFLDAAAATGNIVVTLGESDTRHGIYAVSVGENVRVARTAVVDNLGQSTENISTSVATKAGDLVLFGCGWTNSSTVLDSYGSNQTQVVADDAPTRADVSKKSGLPYITTVTTTLSFNESNIPVGIAVVIEPDASGIAPTLGADVLGVAKWTAAGEGYFFPIETTVQDEN